MAHEIMMLENTIQNYVWGSKTYIAELMRAPCPSSEPQAEVWMGAHPKAPSVAEERPLPEIIADDPIAYLGPDVATRYDNKLPFLFKLLAAGTPLSIQAHPNLEQAREGFARENAEGIPLDAPHRNYKDDNHKPEIICALSEFYGLNGFREIGEILILLDQAKLSSLESELTEFRRQPDTDGLRRFFKTVMELPADQKQQTVAQLVAWAKEDKNDLPESQWILRGRDVFGEDIGLLCILLLNLVELQPGEAMYCAAGDLHAYLDGFGVELMANSDNVLRGGCTVKHVDVPELVSLLTFDDRKAQIIAPEARPDGQKVYPTPAPEFELAVIDVDDGAPWTSPDEHTVEIIVCTEGHAVVTDHDVELPLSGGQSVLVPADAGTYLITGDAKLYKASVGS